jgi:hypothetical protein
MWTRADSSQTISAAKRTRNGALLPAQGKGKQIITHIID